ncbi:hypothetical protein E4J89_16165 [Arthrobacter sp. CAU 1506]|uniref:hypothetical protein n=1 Tax=Arthrobacter sp. CAU 1506 TaxID=2560052 RepID=UPI0010AB9320|nr:hypothetical protein [Arthrobacter sp. CAU 1506]TJY67236.1 hypothetical protein E4J89_16165 [Arthrobacter sp. CAU 1506]
MKIAPKNRVQRTLVAGAAALTLLASTGCGAINEQATTKSYSASDGIVANVGPIGLRNVMVVAENADSAGRILGTVVNSSDSPVQLSMTGSGSTATVTVPADGQINFEDEKNKTTVDRPGAAPGALANVTVRVNNESAEVKIPVLDGTLPEYSSFLPTPAPTESAAPEESPAPTTEATDEAGA